jgi:hypothetical protein
VMAAPGNEVNLVAVWTLKPVVSEFVAGQQQSDGALLSKYSEDEGGRAAADAGAGNA